MIILFLVAKAVSQQPPLTPEQEKMAINPNSPDPTQFEEIVPESTNLLAFPESCPPGFEELAEAPSLSEIERLQAQGAKHVVLCQETLETISKREAERLKLPLPPSLKFKSRSWSSGVPKSPDSDSGFAPLPPEPQLPEGLLAGPACPPDWEEVPGGAEQYGIGPVPLEGFEPVPLKVCRAKTQGSSAR